MTHSHGGYSTVSQAAPIHNRVLGLRRRGGALEVLDRCGGLAWPGGLIWPVATGLVLIAVGIGLRAWPIAALGRFFQYQIEVQPGHHVVTSGPYRYVRHPSYSGITLVLAGIALARDDVWGLVAVAVLGGAGLGVRIRAEERQLAGCSAASTKTSRSAASALCLGGVTALVFPRRRRPSPVCNRPPDQRYG